MMFDDDYYKYKQYWRANRITGGAVPIIIVLSIFLEVGKFIKGVLIIAAVLWAICYIVRKCKK